MMTGTLFLLLAAANPYGGQATAIATARVVRGERISLAAPSSAPDRLLRQTVWRDPAQGLPVTLRLVEFH